MQLRKVTYKDLEFIYKLTFSRQARKYSFYQTKPFFAEHRVWWKNRLADKTFQAKIILHRKACIGIIRRDRSYISIIILPKFQNKGLGTQALKKFCVKGDKAEILWHNKKSVHVFKKAGFRPHATRFIKA